MPGGGPDGRGLVSGVSYARLGRRGGRGSPRRSILAALAVCTAILVPTACGGSSTTAAQRDEQLVQRDVTSGLGTGRLDKIACSGSRCRVATTYAFRSFTEASLVAVPIVFFVNADDRAPLVRTIRLEMTSWAMDRTAEFDCHLTRPMRSGSYDVTWLHRICSATFAPA